MRHLYLEPKERPYPDERDRFVAWCGEDGHVNHDETRNPDDVQCPKCITAFGRQQPERP